MPAALRGSLITTRRWYLASRRISGCIAISPLLCLQLVLWRLALPALKYIVPVRTLARFMWVAPSKSMHHHLDHAETRPRLESLLYVWKNGGRLLVSPNCFERSLVLYRLLSRAGANPHIVLGLSRRDGVVAGHAWVELEGRLAEGEPVDTYDRVAAFGPNGRPVEHAPLILDGKCPGSPVLS